MVLLAIFVGANLSFAGDDLEGRRGEPASPDVVSAPGDFEVFLVRERYWPLERLNSSSAPARRTAARRLFTPSFSKMFLVCVRSVLSDTTISRAISGPLRSVRRKRRTSISRSLRRSMRSGWSARAGVGGAGASARR